MHVPMYKNPPYLAAVFIQGELKKLDCFKSLQHLISFVHVCDDTENIPCQIIKFFS